MRLAPLGLAFAVLAPLPLAGQAPNAPAAEAPASPAVSDKEKEISAHKTELQGVEDTIGASDAQRQKIEAEVENLRGDRARLSAALIETTQQIQDNETKVSDAEARLAGLWGREDAIRRSLASRRDVIAEVLASLQRMGRTPPPALLVSPEDMLQAIRTSMLLGAVVPQMRAETEALASDLSALVQLRQAVATEKTQLAQKNTELELQRQKLAALVSARQASLGVAEKALDAEQQRAADLARQATSMKQLIGKMEEDLARREKGRGGSRESRSRPQARRSGRAARSKNDYFAVHGSRPPCSRHRLRRYEGSVALPGRGRHPLTLLRRAGRRRRYGKGHVDGNAARAQLSRRLMTVGSPFRDLTGALDKS